MTQKPSPPFTGGPKVIWGPRPQARKTRRLWPWRSWPWQSRPCLSSPCLQSRPRLLLPWLQVLLLLFCAASVSAQDKTLTVRPIADAPNFAKMALVIGVGHYEHAGILAPATENDARQFADLLRTQFKFPANAITLLTDEPGAPDSLRPTYIHLRNALKTLIASINEKSEVIIYFSGHGIRAEDHDWLVPLDYVPDDLTSTCINYDDFKNQLNTKLPARALLIVDACRNLTGGKGAGSSGFGAGEGLAGPQFAELLSCQPKQESKVGKPEDFNESVFTHFLLQGLKGDPDAQDNGVVTFDSLKLFVQGSVSQYVTSKYGEAQKPDGRASLGKMVLARGQAVAQSPGHHDLATNTNPERSGAPAVNKERMPGKVPHIDAQYGLDLVEIPAGEFTMGSMQEEFVAILRSLLPSNASQEEKNAALRSNDALDILKPFTNEFPQHKVYLDTYYIARNVVTVRQYLVFCATTGHAKPDEPSWGWKEDHPVVNVSWNDAVAYCAWLSQATGFTVTLPTEAQWEKAARGRDGRSYSWGNQWDSSKLHCSKAQFGDAGSTTSVGSYPSGASPYGVLDMAGNVWQWCSDWYDENYYKSSPDRNPSGPASGRNRVVRGSSWQVVGKDGGLHCRCAFRIKVSPDHRGNDVGFRCVVQAR